MYFWNCIELYKNSEVVIPSKVCDIYIYLFVCLCVRSFCGRRVILQPLECWMRRKWDPMKTCSWRKRTGSREHPQKWESRTGRRGRSVCVGVACSVVYHSPVNALPFSHKSHKVYSNALLSVRRLSFAVYSLVALEGFWEFYRTYLFWIWHCKHLDGLTLYGNGVFVLLWGRRWLVWVGGWGGASVREGSAEAQ